MLAYILLEVGFGNEGGLAGTNRPASVLDGSVFKDM